MAKISAATGKVCTDRHVKVNGSHCITSLFSHVSVQQKVQESCLSECAPLAEANAPCSMICQKVTSEEMSVRSELLLNPRLIAKA